MQRLLKSTHLLGKVFLESTILTYGKVLTPVNWRQEPVASKLPGKGFADAAVDIHRTAGGFGGAV